MSRSIAVEELSEEGFGPFGTFASLVSPKGNVLGEEPILFFPDMQVVDLGVFSQAAISVCRVRQRPAVIDITEYHTSVGEGVLPLDTDVIIHVGPPTGDGEPPLEAIRAFVVPKLTQVVLHPGVWHHAPFVEDGDVAHVQILLPRRTYANDCKIRPLEEAIALV